MNDNSVSGDESGVGGNASTPASTTVCWGSYHPGYLWRDFLDWQNKIFKVGQAAWSSTGTSRATAGQQAATQRRIQPAGMSARGSTVAEWPTTQDEVDVGITVKNMSRWDS